METTERLHFHTLEKEMATHSSVLAWRIPGMGEPGGLLSMGSHRVGHNWSDLAAAAAAVLLANGCFCCSEETVSEKQNQTLLRPTSKSVLPLFSSVSIMTSGLTAKSSIHFEFICIVCNRVI